MSAESRAQIVQTESQPQAKRTIVELGQLLDTARHEQLRGDALFDDQNDTLGGLDADRRRAQLERSGNRVRIERLLGNRESSQNAHLNGLNGVLDLEETTLGREGVHTTVVLAPEHGIAHKRSVE